ncbi:MAG: RsmB/NOP family class I SAM-dependent RNA methyltransferase [Nitrososphaerales archaeon]
MRSRRSEKGKPRDFPQLPVPPAFLERMARLLGDGFDAFLASYDAPPVQGLRVNTLKIGVDELRTRLPFSLEPVPWSRETFVLTGSLPRGNVPTGSAARPGKHLYHAAGLYYLQDPSATAAVELLDPQPGEAVLDLSAAPGGKATHIVARLQGQGLLVANEVIQKRAWELAGNLERWGATNVAITTESPERLAERWPGFFDAVLVDAPCSGEGMFRKSEVARREWTPALVQGCALRQHSILDHVAALVRPGGRLVYSTCTFAPEEDEGTVARFLRSHPEFSLAEPAGGLQSLARPGFEPGRPEWLPPELQPPQLVRCVRLWPHHIPGEGHFAALLQKSEAAAQSERPAAYDATRLPRIVEEAYAAFVAGTFIDPPAVNRLSLTGAYLYAVPTGLPDLSGLRYLHPGWWLGEVKKDRCEPSHALAFAVRSNTVRRVVDFAADDENLLAYLRGETIVSPGEDGWTLVAVDGFSLGWAKRVGGRLKSHYPKGLRMLG